MKVCKVCGNTQYQNALYGNSETNEWRCWDCIDHSKRGKPKPVQMVDGIPRRSRTDCYTPAETAIRAAMLAVEDAGCHKLLTDAVDLLGKAQAKVADFVELDEFIECPQCDGTGSVSNEHYELYSDEETPCPKCDGSGRIESKEKVNPELAPTLRFIEEYVANLTPELTHHLKLLAGDTIKRTPNVPEWDEFELGYEAVAPGLAKIRVTLFLDGKQVDMFDVGEQRFFALIDGGKVYNPVISKTD